MAIAYDSGAYTNPSPTNSVTLSKTNTGSDIALVVFVELSSTTDDMTGVTYNGVSMTQAWKGHRIGIGRWNYLYVLLNAASGTNNIVASCSTSTIESVMATSYTGVSHSFYDVTGGPGTLSSNTISLNLTTTADKDWIVYGAIATNYPVTPTNMTLRVDSGIGFFMYDSNQAISPAGSYTASFYNASLVDGLLAGVALEPTITNYTMTAGAGSYTYTGFAATLGRIYTMIAAAGSYLLSGFSAVMSYVPFKWMAESKNTSTWNAESKNTSTWNAESKNTSTWNAESKNTST